MCLQSDTPENLLDRTGEGFGRVLRLSSRQTDQLGAGESKGCSDEDRADTLEAVADGTRIIPETGAPVFAEVAVGRSASEDADEGDDHEDDDSGQLETAGPEFLLSVSEHAEDVDQNDEEKENGNPDTNVDVHAPIADCETGDDEFKRQDNGPLEDVVPTHGETPRRIDEPGRISIETAGNGIHDGKLAQRIHDVEDHETDDAEIDDERSRTLDRWYQKTAHDGQEEEQLKLTPRLRALPEPTKRPAPMEPPMAIMWRWRVLSVWLS